MPWSHNRSFLRHLYFSQDRSKWWWPKCHCQRLSLGRGSVFRRGLDIMGLEGPVWRCVFWFGYYRKAAARQRDIFDPLASCRKRKDASLEPRGQNRNTLAQGVKFTCAGCCGWRDNIYHSFCQDLTADRSWGPGVSTSWKKIRCNIIRYYHQVARYVGGQWRLGALWIHD